MEEEKIKQEDGPREATNFEKELECQICLCPVVKPVMLPCQSHSICLGCLSNLVQRKSKASDGRGNVHCPTCGPESGSMRATNMRKVVVNKELERLKQAYYNERNSWQLETKNLKAELDKVKFYMTDKEAQKVEKEPIFEDVIQEFQTDNLKDLFTTIASILRKRGEDPESLLYGNTKSRHVNGKRKVSEETTDASGDENLYPYHPNIKKVKSK